MPVAGFFVTNNAYTVNDMLGNGWSKKFDDTDWLNIVCVGKLAGVTTGTVVVELAKDGKYIKDWTYVDLSSLGQVNEVMFTMTGSDMSYGYLNTPAYFCLDNFGAAMPVGYNVPEMASFAEAANPTALEETEDNNAAEKQLRSGILYIIRDGKMYNAQGMIVK